MAVMNSLFQVIRMRPQYALHCTNALLDFFKSPPAYLTSTQMKSIEKTVKSILLLTVSIPAVASLEPLIADVLIRLGMRPYEIDARLRRDQKRLADDELERDRKKQHSSVKLKLSIYFIGFI